MYEFIELCNCSVCVQVAVSTNKIVTLLLTDIFEKFLLWLLWSGSKLKKLKCVSKFCNKKRQKQITRRRNGNTCFVALLLLPLPLTFRLPQPLSFLVAWRGIDSHSYSYTEASLDGGGPTRARHLCACNNVEIKQRKLTEGNVPTAVDLRVKFDWHTHTYVHILAVCVWKCACLCVCAYFFD